MLGKFIKDLRKRHGLKQEFLAGELGLSRPTYLQIEQGKRELTVSEAEKLAGIFGIALADFLQEKESSLVVKIEKDKKRKGKKGEEIRISVPQSRVDKFKQVFLYILKQVGGKPNIGETVLYKLLYFIDFDYYEKYEEQLMGLAYLKNTYGPTPLLFKRIVEQMRKDGEIEKVKSKFHQYPQTKYLCCKEPDLSVLNGIEKDHIDWELQRLSDCSAIELTKRSHRDVPWLSAQNGERLDYESVFYRTDNTSVRDYGISDDNEN